MKFVLSINNKFEMKINLLHHDSSVILCYSESLITSYKTLKMNKLSFKIISLKTYLDLSKHSFVQYFIFDKNLTELFASLHKLNRLY